MTRDQAIYEAQALAISAPWEGRSFPERFADHLADRGWEIQPVSTPIVESRRPA